MPKMQSIQILRAIAALSVVMLHCAWSWVDAEKRMFPEPIFLAAYGVDLFFVISGFIICSTARATPSAANFLRKRFTRVVPYYYIQTIPFVLLTLVTWGFDPARLATSFLFWPMWGPRPSEPLLTVGWTLSFEVLFYTAFAGAMRFGVRGAAVLLIAYIGAVALNMAGAGGAFSFIGNPLLGEFLLGVLIASTPNRNLAIRGVAAILFACVILVLRAEHGLGHTYDNGWWAFDPTNSFLRFLCAGLPAAFLVWGALQIEPWCRGRIVAVLSYLGDASYSIYLTHKFIILAVATVWAAIGAPPIAVAFVAYPCGIAAGVWAFERIEKPLLAFLRGKTHAVSRTVPSSGFVF